MGKYSDCWTYPMEVIDEKLHDITDHLGTASELNAAKIGNTDIVQMKSGESNVFPRTSLYRKHISCANKASFVIDLVKAQTSSLYCNLFIYNANVGVMSMIATKPNDQILIKDIGTTELEAAISGKDLTISIDGSSLWGITDIYVTATYDIGTDEYFPA